MRRWIVVALVLSGCAAKAELTPAGSFVREIDSSQGVEVRSECRFLGIVEGEDTRAEWGDALAGRRGSSSLAALNEIRNKVADLGGNAFLVVAVADYSAQAEAYLCGGSTLATVQG